LHQVCKNHHRIPKLMHYIDLKYLLAMDQHNLDHGNTFQ